MAGLSRRSFVAWLGTLSAALGFARRDASAGGTAVTGAAYGGRAEARGDEGDGTQASTQLDEVMLVALAAAILPSELGADGSARGIYVLDLEAEDWNELLRAVARGPWRYAFSLDEWAAPLPKYGIEAFAMWRQAAPLLELLAGAVSLRCRSRNPQHLEVEVDPAEVLGVDHLEELVRFMAWLGRILHRTVLLAPDDAPERPILEYVDATRRVRFHAVAS